MCLILDASKFGDFLDAENQDMQLVRKWIEKKGKIAYSPTRKFKEELGKSKRMKEQFAEYSRAAKLKTYNKEKVENAQEDLSDLQSDDPHIIALAKVGNVRLLVSGDHALHEDFKKIMRGSVYQNRTHGHLLDEHSCP